MTTPICPTATIRSFEYIIQKSYTDKLLNVLMKDESVRFVNYHLL